MNCEFLQQKYNRLTQQQVECQGIFKNRYVSCPDETIVAQVHKMLEECKQKRHSEYRRATAELCASGSLEGSICEELIKTIQKY